MDAEPREYCYRCKTTQPCHPVSHSSGTEWLCVVCGWQVYFDLNEEDLDDGNEPIRSCESCGSDIYLSDDDGTGLCGQCQFYRRMGVSGSSEEIG